MSDLPPGHKEERLTLSAPRHRIERWRRAVARTLVELPTGQGTLRVELYQLLDALKEVAKSDDD